MYDLSETELEKLSLILGYNASDITFGWNGRVSGLTLQYSHFTDKAVEHGYHFSIFSKIARQPRVRLKCLSNL